MNLKVLLCADPDLGNKTIAKVDLGDGGKFRGAKLMDVCVCLQVHVCVYV